jgi:hypothetical protein
MTPMLLTRLSKRVKFRLDKRKNRKKIPPTGDIADAEIST